ncbi:MAG TPA: BamA/TamA family outer membrane protein [Geobacteraceae bacterium]
MRFQILALFLAVLSLGMTACTSVVPRKNLPYPLTTDEFGDEVKVVSIPLPVIASSPNEGVTYGALTAFLLHNKEDEASTLLAPQVNQNKNFGTTFSVYGAFYPSPQSVWEVNLARSTDINEDYEIKYVGRPFSDRKYELNTFVYDFADGSARFFGFQSGSPRTAETNYNDREAGVTVSVGYQIARHVQLVLGERFRKVTIGPGAVNGIPFIRDVYSVNSVPGIDGFTAHAQKIALVYSTLDSPTAPTFGGYAKLVFENSAKFLGSSADYRHYEVEARAFFPLENGRFVTATRLAYNQTLGSNVPFLERSILGGETTLRGYGRNRFIDSSYLLLNLEERIRLFRWEVFGVNADWELAPFIDFGSVMKALDRADTRSFEFNPGIGFRAVVRPNITGRLDIGFGKDGPALFVGLGYPF